MCSGEQKNRECYRVFGGLQGTYVSFSLCSLSKTCFCQADVVVIPTFGRWRQEFWVQPGLPGETLSQKIKPNWVVVVTAHAFNSTIWEAEVGRSEFEASLVYRASSRIPGLYRETLPWKTNKNQNNKNWTKTLANCFWLVGEMDSTGGFMCVFYQCIGQTFCYIPIPAFKILLFKVFIPSFCFGFRFFWFGLVWFFWDRVSLCSVSLAVLECNL